MAEKKTVIRNLSDKPTNIIMHEHEIDNSCIEIEKQLPSFLRGYFNYLKKNVLPMTRLAYLQDIKFFMKYLVNDTGLTLADNIKNIKLSEMNDILAVDVNMFIDYCRQYEVETDKERIVFENGNKTLARKKSSISVMFKWLYREGFIDKNITDGFEPIRVPKASDKEIKALDDDEVMNMLDAVSTGKGLTKKELEFWNKTKYRDKAILVLFVTYGLRLSELYQLNVSSFNFNRGEFKIYRKRGKEANMPINMSVEKVIEDYLTLERADDDELSEEDKDAMFLSLQGHRMTQRQIRELVKKYTSIAMQTSRNGGYSPHKLRATAATSLIEKGNSIYDVADLLDHEQVTTTQLYAQHRKHAKEDLIRNSEWLENNKEKED